jgi:large subunit ribosomal protein L6
MAWAAKCFASWRKEKRVSRIAKYPIAVPKGVEVNVASGQISVKGPLGVISRPADPNVAIDKSGDQLLCKALGNSNHADAMSGTMRALVANMVTGVTKGFEKKLALVGVGYRAQAQGDKLNLTLGFSHPVVHQMPKGVKVATPTQTEIIITGVDKQQVGQVAAEVRAHRPPEPYKGKGVRYSDEVIVLKETKKK